MPIAYTMGHELVEMWLLYRDALKLEVAALQTVTTILEVPR